VVQIENFTVTGNRTPYSFSVSTVLSIFISSFVFPSHFLKISSSLLLSLSLVLLTCVVVSASKLVKVVQNLAAQSGAISLNLVLHVSNYSELYTLYSFDSNDCDGIQFLEHLESGDKRHNREMTVGVWETNIILSIVLNCRPGL